MTLKIVKDGEGGDGPVDDTPPPAKEIRRFVKFDDGTDNLLIMEGAGPNQSDAGFVWNAEVLHLADDSVIAPQDGEKMMVSMSPVAMLWQAIIIEDPDAAARTEG
jgi:hypothetical protein